MTPRPGPSPGSRPAFRLLLFAILTSGGVASAASVAPRFPVMEFGHGGGLDGGKVIFMLLAGLGLKFMALLPIILTKLTVLGTLNFVSATLNLLLTIGFNIRKMLLGAKQPKTTTGIMTQEEFVYQHPEYAEHELFKPSHLPGQLMSPAFRYEIMAPAAAPEPHALGSKLHQLVVPTQGPRITRLVASAGINGNPSAGLLESRTGALRLSRDGRTRPRSQGLRVVLPPGKGAHQEATRELGRYKCYWIGEGRPPGGVGGDDLQQQQQHLLEHEDEHRVEEIVNQDLQQQMRQEHYERQLMMQQQEEGAGALDRQGSDPANRTRAAA